MWVTAIPGRPQNNCAECWQRWKNKDITALSLQLSAFLLEFCRTLNGGNVLKCCPPNPRLQFAMKKLHVALGERSYPIYIGSGLIDDAELIGAHIHGKEALVVTNETVAPLYLDRVKNSLSSGLSLAKLDSLVLPDGEIYKNLDTLKSLYDHLLKNRHSRSTTLIALGGGVIGDMTG